MATLGVNVLTPLVDVRARLRTVQAQLEAQLSSAPGAWPDARRSAWRSLDPARERASSLASIHAATLATLAPSHRDVLSEALAEGLCELALAQLDAFPGNLFWDLDLIAAELTREAAKLEPEPARICINQRFDRMVELQHLYGRNTKINFSYVHDFVYGFDWAKWVAREPSLHAKPPGPFSREFLDSMLERGHELLALIAKDDRKYPSLPDDEARNPFPFSREPAQEIRLHRELARRDLIPVPTWLGTAAPRDWATRWQIDFAKRRAEVAAELVL